MPRLGTEDAVKSIHPLPPLPEQRRIVAKIDELMARVDELERKRNARNERRIAMHQAAVAQLLDAGDAGASRGGRDFIFAHFADLYSTKENVAELRKAILQLAVMGRLVQQDHNDPPASELLKEIEAEKKRLVQEGTIKEPKPLPPITPEEVPYQLPGGWEWVRLGKISCTITKGSSPNWQGISYTDNPEDVLFITSENVGSYHLLLDKKKYVERKFNDIEPRSILMRGDFLMNIVGASIGRTAIFQEDVIANINQAVCLIRCMSSNLNSEYLLLYFNTPICVSFMFDKQVENARANLSMGNIALFLIPLPPLPEQQRIVAKVDELMALCDALEKKIDERTAKESALLEAVAARV
jgi:type I restriction enzyme S subunit